MKRLRMHARPYAVRSAMVRDRQGYLLVEILIALAIFSIGFLAIGALIFATTRNNATGHILTQATLLAVETLEDLKREDMGELTIGVHDDLNNPIDERGNAGGIFNRSWIIEDPLGYNTSRRIRVRVSWDRLGHRKSVELTTITRGNGI